MHRKMRFFAVVVFASLCFTVSTALSQTDAAVDLEKEPWKEPLPEGLYIRPYLQNATQSSMVVMWETRDAIIGHVDYGATASFGNTVSESAPVTIHEVRIGDLHPGATYQYRVRYSDVALEPSTFTTAPPDGVVNCRILVYGDARSNPKQHRKNVERMLEVDPDIILHTGDIVASGIVYEQWQPQHFWPLQIISDKVPSFATLGNHERNSTHHFNYMSLPGNEVYYSFDYANVHIICLDSNRGSTPYQAGAPQYEWLIEDLEANQDADWIFVYFHHPIFRCHPTRGIEAQRYTWHPIFEKYGVDIVFSGHDHYYFRSYPIGELELQPKQGVLYVTSGGGGASLYPVRDRIHGVVNNSIHHIVEIDVQGSRIEAQAIDSEGNQVDGFTLTHTPTPGESYIAYEIFEIERDLTAQLAALKPIVVEKAGDRVAIDTTLSIPTDFNLRIEGDIEWEADANWKFSPLKTPFVINPGAPLKIPIKAESTYPNIYPIPKLTVHFSKTVGRQDTFRNSKLTFDAIKVQPLAPVTVRRIYSSVDIDGALIEPAWTAATKLSDFVTAQGSARPAQKFTAMLAHDGAYLYAAAQIEGDPGLVEKGETVRDDDDILEKDDHFGVSLSDGSQIYVFGVNARGVQIDSKTANLTWNLDWVSRTVATETGWIAELAIPLAAFGSHPAAETWRIGVQRGDDVNDEIVSLSPTYTVTSRENKLPEYRHETSAIKSLKPSYADSLSPVMFENTVK